MAEQKPPEGNFFSHLLELRNRLIYIIGGLMVVFVPAAIFSQELYTVVAKPLLSVLPEGSSMIATEVASPFIAPLKLAFIVALTVSIPYLLYQIWAFVAPGLYRHERKLVIPLLVSSTLLFYTGMAFAYFVVFPLVFGFFTQVAPEGVQIMTDISAYLNFVFSMFIAFGVAFEVPVAVVLLTKAGIVDPESLAKKRPYVVLWVFVLAMFLTPPDAISQLLLAFPMLVLFEIGLFLSRRMVKSSSNSKDEDKFRQLTDAEMEAEMDKHEKESS